MIRLAGALLVEQCDEWLVGRRYLWAESLALALVDEDEGEEDREEVRVLQGAGAADASPASVGYSTTRYVRPWRPRYSLIDLIRHSRESLRRTGEVGRPSPTRSRGLVGPPGEALGVRALTVLERGPTRP